MNWTSPKVRAKKVLPVFFLCKNHLQGTQVMVKISGLKRSTRFQGFAGHIKWDPIGGDQTMQIRVVTLRDFPFNSALFGVRCHMMTHCFAT